MASIEYLLLFLVATSLISYFVTKLNTFIGSIVTIFATMFVFISLIAYGSDLSLNTTVNLIPGLSFELTYVGVYFSIIISFIYLMVSFFHPYFLDKYKHKNVYNMLFLLSLAGVLGTFFADNFIQLFFFFEFIVWTSMFLIPLGKSKSAAVSYYGFSAAGSFAMLFGIFIMYSTVGSFSIDAGLAGISGTNANIVFVAFMIGAFAKLGAFPLHIWLPIAHGNAPHPFSPVLSGALVKLGAFVAVLALIRISPASTIIEAIGLPVAQYIIALLGGVSIVFGTLMAIKEDDAKKLLAYSSMSHGGYILVAFSLMSSVAFAGGFYHILAHALASAGAFLAIAAVARQTGTTKMSELGGIIHKMPITYIVYLVAIISMAGIPPMGGFVSKWLIFQAVINKGLVFVGIAVFFGSIGSFLYVFRPLAALFLGQELPKYKTTVKEAPILMLIPMIIITLLNIYTGVFTNTILGFINKIIIELGYSPIILNGLTVQGFNGTLAPATISLVFGVGVAVAFIIFIV
ncbi:MAG: proton-conducting transporter membrane subunit, partial [Candidatus Izemoplasmatales bacterium]|nr:proton-conducting transporter membrane subunit [Candidatus Izemoplasmatales bacterium]